jgi:hypothetical protein
MCLLRGTDWVFKCKITHVEDLGLPLWDALSLRECFSTFGSIHEKGQDGGVDWIHVAWNMIT